MDCRFPLDNAPNATVRESIDAALASMNLDHSNTSFMDANERSFVGPYGTLSYSPAMVEPLFQAGRALYNPQICKPRNRELALLGLTSIIRVPLIVEEHRPICQRLGITTEQYEDGLSGKPPQGLSEEETMAYKLGRVFTKIESRLNDAIWEEATEKMTKSEIAGIAHVVGGYLWMTLLANING